MAVGSAAPAAALAATLAALVVAAVAAVAPRRRRKMRPSVTTATPAAACRPIVASSVAAAPAAALVAAETHTAPAAGGDAADEQLGRFGRRARELCARVDGGAGREERRAARTTSMAEVSSAASTDGDDSIGRPRDAMYSAYVDRAASASSRARAPRARDEPARRARPLAGLRRKPSRARPAPRSKEPRGGRRAPSRAGCTTRRRRSATLFRDTTTHVRVELLQEPKGFHVNVFYRYGFKVVR